MRRQLRDALDDVGDLRAEQLLDAVDGGQRVFDDVVQQARRDGHGVQAHVREDVRDFERVDEVWLAGVAHLSLVLHRREDVGPPQQLDVGFRCVTANLLDQILEANHVSTGFPREGGRLCPLLRAELCT